MNAFKTFAKLSIAASVIYVSMTVYTNAFISWLLCSAFTSNPAPYHMHIHIAIVSLVILRLGYKKGTFVICIYDLLSSTIYFGIWSTISKLWGFKLLEIFMARHIINIAFHTIAMVLMILFD